MTDYLDLQSKINASYNRLNIDPNEKKSEVDDEKYAKVISNGNQNGNNEELINFCNNYYSCFDEPAKLCDKKKISSNKIKGYSSGDTSNLDLQYDDLLQKIEELQQSMTIKKDNLKMGQLATLYKNYQLAEIDLTKQTNDNMYIDTKNEIIQTKHNYELNKMRIYALMIVILTMINIWFYITFLQNKL
jgi:hypothetical protein